MSRPPCTFLRSFKCLRALLHLTVNQYFCIIKKCYFIAWRVKMKLFWAYFIKMQLKWKSQLKHTHTHIVFTFLAWDSNMNMGFARLYFVMGDGPWCEHHVADSLMESAQKNIYWTWGDWVFSVFIFSVY